MMVIYFHVSQSAWPILLSLGLMTIVGAGLIVFFFEGSFLFFISFFSVLACIFLWWRDVHRESCYIGEHSEYMSASVRLGVGLFILSELIFFFSIFWGFFQWSSEVGLNVGIVWPPVGVEPFNPYSIPTLNTFFLLSSGVFVTCGHHLLILGDVSGAVYYIDLACLLGLIFSLVQGYEYVIASFNWGDSVYGAIFFLATGFHGLHVAVGFVFLSVIVYRIIICSFSIVAIGGLEFSIWYWHFVDVVWLFLFVFVYFN